MHKSTYYSLGVILLLVLVACSKDKLETRPSIKLKNVFNRTVPKGNQVPLIVEFDYTDKEGDIGNSMFVQKTRLNQRVVPTNNRDTFSMVIPQMETKKTDGQIELRLYPIDLQMANNPGNPPEPDTMNIRFALRDRAGNVSDTVSIGQVILIR